jgi:hypothetical protein
VSWAVGVGGGAADKVEVSGARACPLLRPCLNLDARGCGLVGTAVCVELLDVDELEGVGEDGREGVGVRAEEDSERALIEATEECPEVDGVGIVDGGIAVVGTDDRVGEGSRMSEARCCSCRDASDEARRCEQRLAS